MAGLREKNDFSLKFWLKANGGGGHLPLILDSRSPPRSTLRIFSLNFTSDDINENISL
jgi:hypothetical protein